MRPNSGEFGCELIKQGNIKKCGCFEQKLAERSDDSEQIQLSSSEHMSYNRSLDPIRFIGACFGDI